MATKQFKIARVKGAIDPGKPAKIRYRTIHQDGKSVRVRVIDTDGGDFTAQFLSAFRSNVRKARKENKKLAEKA